MNIVYTLNEVMLGRLRVDKKTYDFLPYKKLMILCGVMVYGRNCGTWM